MVRPKLYRTRKEKLEASRAKSRRWYHSNHELIATRRRLQRDGDRQFQPSSERLSPPLAKAPDTDVDYDQLPAPLAEALILQRRFLDLTKGSVPEYIHKLHQDVLSKRTQATIDGCPIRAAIDTMEHLKDSVHRCSDRILNDMGCGDEWRQVETILRDVRSTVGGLQELLCEIML